MNVDLLLDNVAGLDALTRASAGEPPADGGDRAHDRRMILLGHPGEDWQRHEAQPLRAGDGARRGMPRELFLIVRMQMKRAPVHRRADARTFQLADEPRTIDREFLEAEPDRKQVPGVNAVCGKGRQFDGLDLGEVGR